MEGLIYLDNHATTPIDPRVLEEMLPCYGTCFGNPSSHSHRAGLEAEMAVERARERISKAIGASPAEIIFTSGATESNNLVLRGVFEAAEGSGKDHIIISGTEHKCVLETAKWLMGKGARLSILPVDSDGRVDPAVLEREICPQTLLVSAIWANNEIGSINPVAELAETCQKHGILFHTDAAQALGRVDVDLRRVPADFLTGSSHKFYGPKGAGFLFVRKRRPAIKLAPQILGGGQENGLRSGTLNVPCIVGMGKALELAQEEMERDFFRAWALRNRLWELLVGSLGDKLVLNGAAVDTLPEKKKDALGLSQGMKRLPGNLNFAVKGLDRDRFFKKTRTVAVSFGAACASGDLNLSHVLKAIGTPADLIQTSIRAGIGRFNTMEEIEEAARIISDAVNGSMLSLAVKD